MCDFHSIIVRRDGAVAHIARNSHSGAVEAADWRENDRMADLREPFFVEAEWNGIGEFTADKITRGSSSMNEKQRKAITNHYGALKKLLADPAEHAERMCLGRGIFAKDEYADVRWKVFIDSRTPSSVVEKLATMPLFADGSVVKYLHPSVITIEGDFSIAEGAEITAPVLAKTGSVYIRQGATFTAPVLAEVTGSVYIRQGATFTAPALAKTGSVDIRQGATFTAPVLAEVTGYVDIRQGATFTAPALAKTGSVYIEEGATFTAPVLAEVTGSVYIRQGATFTAPALAEVTGYVDIRQGATFTAPVLAEVTGSVYIRQGATFTAPLIGYPKA